MTISAPSELRPAASSAFARAALLAWLLSAAGFGLTIFLFYPGYLTNDATFVHGYVEQWHLGDWQSPVMTLLWWLIDPIAPGPGSMFLLTTAIYWLAFAVTAATVARHAGYVALLVPFVALAPPGLIMLSMIWRDILFGACWLLAAALVYAAADRNGPVRVALRALALILLSFGVLLRPNAFAVAPLLLAYIVWPRRFEWKRTALLFVPALAGAYGLIHLVYYDILNVQRENPLQSLLVFDIGGITHFSGENEFPVTWTPEEQALVLDRCYDPKLWDSYWTLPPCTFVMARLERPDDRFFGTPRLVEAWPHALAAHPLAYLEHRLDFMWTFLGRYKIVLEQFHLEDAPISHNPRFKALLPLYKAIQESIIFRVGLWLVISLGIAGFTWRARGTPSGAFAVNVTVCGAAYVLSYAVLGVSADYRYGYWDVVGCLAAVVPAIIARREMRGT